MIYQLPSGRIINISIEQYLNMSDDDLKYCSEQGWGEDPTGIEISSPKEKEEKIEEHHLEIISLEDEEDLLTRIDDSLLDDISDIV